MKVKEIKTYRAVYDKYITHTFGRLHDLKKVETEYKKAYWLWKPYFTKYLGNFDKKESLILDIGCGLGHNLFFFKKMGFKNLFGIDTSQENIIFLKKRGFSAAKIDAFLFLRKNRIQYDVISLFDVIEHFTRNEIVELLTLIRGSLKSKGILIIETPNASYPFFGKLSFGDITHETIFTIQSLGEILLFSGFNNNEIFTVNGIHRWHPNFLIRLLRSVLLNGASAVIENIFRLLALSQGVLLAECKPILISVSHKQNRENK